MVASHGGSPSGLFTAVRGRSSSPDLVPGLWPGEGVAPFFAFAVAFLAPLLLETFLPAEVPGGDDWPVFDFILVGEDCLGVGSLVPLAKTGVAPKDSPSSSRAALPVLPRRIRILSTGMPSSGLILLLIVRFLTKGVSLSILSCGIGSGLEVRTGIFDPDFFNTGLEYMGEGVCSAEISSGVRKSQLACSSSSSRGCGLVSSGSPLAGTLRSSLSRPRLVSLLAGLFPVRRTVARLIPAACSSSLSILASLSR